MTSTVDEFGLKTPPGRIVTTNIEIRAPPDKVRSTFLDFKNFSTWSAFLEQIDAPRSGTDLSTDDNLEVVLGGMGTIRPVVVFNETDSFAWMGRLGFQGIFDGQHEFHFLPGPDSTTRFVHREIFNGVLVTPLLGWAGMQPGIKANFERFNESLKAQVEKD